MAAETEIRETKKLILNRLPPGDRWVSVSSSELVFDSLTEALNYEFQERGYVEFHISAVNGTVEAVEFRVEHIEVKPKLFSLYGER
jgi:hypothetical protein